VRPFCAVVVFQLLASVRCCDVVVGCRLSRSQSDVSASASHSDVVTSPGVFGDRSSNALSAFAANVAGHSALDVVMKTLTHKSTSVMLLHTMRATRDHADVALQSLEALRHIITSSSSVNRRSLAVLCLLLHLT
jgi:hypothetical protein